MVYQETVYQQVNIVDRYGNIIDSFGSGTSSTNESTSSIERSPDLISTEASGLISAGTVSISFSNIGNASGIVLGTSIPSGTSVSFDAPDEDTIGAIAYDATGTIFLISSLR